jgi:hypothetical protein
MKVVEELSRSLWMEQPLPREGLQGPATKPWHTIPVNVSRFRRTKHGAVPRFYRYK